MSCVGERGDEYVADLETNAWPGQAQPNGKILNDARTETPAKKPKLIVVRKRKYNKKTKKRRRKKQKTNKETIKKIKDRRTRACPFFF